MGNTFASISASYRKDLSSESGVKLAENRKKIY